MKKKKEQEFSPSGPRITKDFLVGRNHQHASQQLTIPSKLHTKEAPPWVTKTSQKIILSNESFIILSGFFTWDSFVGRNSKATHAHILREFRHTNPMRLCRFAPAPCMRAMCRVCGLGLRRTSKQNVLSPILLIPLAKFTNQKRGICKHRILYPLRPGPPFPNDAKILKPKVGLGPNQITNWFERC